MRRMRPLAMLVALAVALSAPAPAAPAPAGALSLLEGAALDARTGELVLFGSDDPALPALDPSDLTVALRTRLDAAAPPEERWPGVTLAFSATNESALDVFYAGAVRDTHFGAALFQADRLLKDYGLGQSTGGGSAAPLRSSVPGYQSELACLAEEGYVPPAGQAVEWRKWFSPALTIDVAPDGRSIAFAEARVALSWAYESTLTHPAVDACVGRFVDHFNANYQAFADEQLARGNPALHELAQLARLVGVAEWLNRQGLLGQIEGLDARLPAAPVTAGVTPASTPRVDVAAGLIVQSGGVELRVDPASFRGAAQIPPAAASALRSRAPLTLVDWSPELCAGAQAGRACRAAVYLPRPEPRERVYLPSLFRS